MDAWAKRLRCAQGSGNAQRPADKTPLDLLRKGLSISISYLHVREVLGEDRDVTSTTILKFTVP